MLHQPNNTWLFPGSCLPWLIEKSYLQDWPECDISGLQSSARYGLDATSLGKLDQLDRFLWSCLVLDTATSKTFRMEERLPPRHIVAFRCDPNMIFFAWDKEVAALAVDKRPVLLEG